MGADKKCIPPFMFNLMVRVMEQEGYSADALIDGLAFSLDQLACEDTRISFHDALLMIENAYRITGDPALGLKVGMAVNIGDWGMMGYAVASCGTLWEALQIGQRFSRVATRLTDNRAEPEGDYISLSSRPLYTAGDAERFLIEEDLGGVVGLLHRYMGDGVYPREVRFSYPAPSYVELYEAHFRCPLKFEQPQNCILWGSELMERAVPSRNPAATEMAIRHCEALIAEEDDRGSVVDRVRSRLVQEPGRYPAIQEVAADFNMSESTLRRALKEHDSSFQSILNDVRRKLAIEYLTTSRLKLDEIAVLVGYTDLSNFRRAFKGWTGQAPLEYRRQGAR
ncbi:AraC family transcriptional regulator [Halioglobus maricola]|uniref:AraC family transcriptional regulator n=1 Tax=Halioglobus maricola TaxID=2601894 RepID=A0A5P9NHZ7_9GAMM|nr:AraC family transcriptional regulator [Halioglobus maricola]QFU75457.1 AraC family transcriptional regulator [Halioglobus maricola]